MPIVFEEVIFKEVKLKNRLVVSPMCQYSSEDGFANDWHLVNLGSRAVGGAGLVFTEAASVNPEGRISPGDLGIWKDEHIDNLKKIVTFIHGQGSVAGIQLAHAGRKGSHHSPWEGNRSINAQQGGWKTFAPSGIPFRKDEPSPVAMTLSDIEKVVQDFKQAAVRAHIAGFKILEIHAAHGYLINQFLSTSSNQRSDNYGGSFENRIRLLLEIIHAIKSVWPDDLPVFVRISASEWIPGGWLIEDSIQLAKILKSLDIDLVDCSSGGNSVDQKIPVMPLYQLSFSEQIKNNAGIKTGAVGLITTIEECNMIIENGKADLIFMARELLRNPYFPLLNGPQIWPKQYERARPS